MNYKLLGKSGLRVSEIALGTMGFGKDWGWGLSLDESRQIFDAYTQAGGNFIDTAVNYTNGSSESFVGEFIQSDRGQFVVASKYSLGRRQKDPNAAGNSRKNMVESVNTSLKRLKTDYLDLYWLHAWDYTTPVDEVMRGLDDLVRQGKVLYIGVSDTPAWVVSMANTLADLRGWSRFVALQIRYSLADRAAERDLLPMARALDLAVLPWSILGAGVLSGKYNRDSAAQGRAKNWNVPERSYEIAEELIDVAEEIGCTPSQAAIAWLLAQQSPHHAPIIPILGTSNLDQLADNLGAMTVTLSPEHMARLDEASKIEYGFPHDFLSGSDIRNFLSGGTFESVHNHRRVVLRKGMHRLVLLRHGESTWNKENRFTGWTDVDLTEKGREEARQAGLTLTQEGYGFDLAFTSVLTRAIRTLWIALDEMDLVWLPTLKSWRLNERHYGALQGLNKAEMAKQFGEEQVLIWRRSYDVRPPALEPDDPRFPGNDPRYAELDPRTLPRTECLKDTIVRFIPYWQDAIVPALKVGNRVIIVAHGNSLRALVKYLDNVSDEEIVSLNIPTGIPLVYELDDHLAPITHYYLGDASAVAQAAQAVANQGKATVKA